MSYFDDKEERELKERYPEGSREREVLDYSRSTHIREEVPPMLFGAFKVLMGVTILVCIVSATAYWHH